MYFERKMNMKQISSELGVSVGFVHKKIHEYGIQPRTLYECAEISREKGILKPHKQPSPKRWNKTDDAKLIENYNIKTNDELVKLFPNRTYIGIYKRARKLGLTRDEDIKYINKSNAQKGSHIKTGRTINRKGYVLIFEPDNPRACKSGYVMEHISVFQKNTGIVVLMNCVVHHLNGNKQDNRIENLCLMDRGAHSKYHNLQKKRRFI